MDQNQLKFILNSIQKSKIAVIGDFCLDAYWEIDNSVSEISVETGLETQSVRNQQYSPGGAGNVVANLVDIGVPEIHVFGVLGKDLFGEKLIQLFYKLKIDIDGLCIQEKDWNTQVYLKPTLQGKELNRFDFGNFNRFSAYTAKELLKKIEGSIADFEVIIINQQTLKGIYTKFFRNSLNTLISSCPEKIFLTDSRVYADQFSGTIRKINEFEVMKLSGYDVNPDDIIEKKQVIVAVKNLSSKWNKAIFVTCGEAGTIICENDQVIEIPVIKITGEIDPVGAGDSFLSAAGAALAAGENMRQAAELGNLAACVTVQKLFCTGTATADEIIDLNKKY